MENMVDDRAVGWILSKAPVGISWKQQKTRSKQVWQSGFQTVGNWWWKSFPQYAMDTTFSMFLKKTPTEQIYWGITQQRWWITKTLISGLMKTRVTAYSYPLLQAALTMQYHRMYCLDLFPCSGTVWYRQAHPMLRLCLVLPMLNNHCLCRVPCKSKYLLNMRRYATHLSFSPESQNHRLI